MLVFIEYSRNEGTMRRMCASLFKAGCLKIMDDVQSSGEPVVITKRGAAIVKVVPLISESSDPFRSCPASSELSAISKLRCSSEAPKSSHEVIRECVGTAACSLRALAGTMPLRGSP